MNKDKAREAFEAHASQNGKFPAVVHRGEDGEYTNPFTHSTHRAWTAALQWAASQPQDAKAWAVLGEDGDVSMVFIDRDEALTYCGEGEQPMPLVFGGAASQQAAEGDDELLRLRAKVDALTREAWTWSKACESESMRIHGVKDAINKAYGIVSKEHPWTPEHSKNYPQQAANIINAAMTIFAPPATQGGAE